MFLSEASIRRPVAMGCLVIALALLGLNSMRKMGLELMPRADVPLITIVTVYPGATPSEIETDVAKRIEDAVVSIDGLKHVTSSCMQNACHTHLEFQLDVDVNVAATDVREKLDLIRADFPEDVEDPKIEKFDINAKPIVNLALTGDVPVAELYDFADNDLKDRITVIPGVASVELVGGEEREVQVRLDRRKLAARGLSAIQVTAAVANGIKTIPSGNLKDGPDEYTVKFNADYEDIEDIGTLEVANIQGQRCHISDIGEVRMATGEVRKMAFIDGRPCVAIRVVKKAEANAVAVAAQVRKEMDALKRNLPGGMELVWVSDDGRFIEATSRSAWTNVAQGIVLTALVLFVFLYNFRALFVIAVTMPLTIIIGVFFMYMAGFTLNSATLIAIGMSIGILVTNSVVVLEAIVKRVDESGDPRKAASLGAKEAFVAVLASAGTNIVVLFPLSVMGSMVGFFIKPLALTMLIMTAVSLFISFTLTPMLCSLLLKPREASSGSFLARIERIWNRGFEAVRVALRRALGFNERHRWAALLLLALVALMFVWALRLASTLGSTLVERPDQGQVFVKLEFPARYNLESTVERTADAERRLQDLPELRHLLTTIGKVEGVAGQSPEGVYLAQLLLRFSERDEREETIHHLSDEIRDRLADYPGAIITVSQPDIVGGQGAEIEMEIAGDDLQRLEELALKTLAVAGPLPLIEDPDTTVRLGKPQFTIRPDRSVLTDMRMPATALGMNLRANLEGLTAGTYKKNARNYDIVVKLAEQKGAEQVREFMFPGEPGRPILLENIADIEQRHAPVQITRKDKRRISKFLANPAASTPLGTAVSAVSDAVDENVGMPPGYEYGFAGIYEFMIEGQEALLEAAVMSVVLVFLTLAAILESFKQPLLILATLPLALIGVFAALAAAGSALDIFAIMGCVMLVGIVVNNAILIMDQFNVHLAEGIPRHKAMITATCERFRPIVMITFAAVLGMLPLALGRGIGAELRNGVGIASAGGIFISGVLSLFVLPILYDLFTRKDSGHQSR